MIFITIQRQNQPCGFFWMVFIIVIYRVFMIFVNYKINPKTILAIAHLTR